MVPCFVKTKDDIIFFAFNKVGDEYLCFPKNINGYKGKKYSEWYEKRIYSLQKYYKYLEGLDRMVYLVKQKDIEKVYDPLLFIKHKCYLDLDKELSFCIQKIVNNVSNFFGIEIDDIGIEGSILLGDCSKNSDIDILVYGKQNGKKIQDKFLDFSSVDGISLFSDIQAEDYVIKRIDCGYGNTISSMKKQFLRRYYGFVYGKQFSIVCVPYENEDGYIDLNRKIKSSGIYEGYLTITNADNSCVMPCTYEATDGKENFVLEVYNHYGINQLKNNERVFVKAEKYLDLQNNQNIIIFAFWNNVKERFDLYE